MASGLPASPCQSYLTPFREQLFLVPIDNYLDGCRSSYQLHRLMSQQSHLQHGFPLTFQALIPIMPSWLRSDEKGKTVDNGIRSKK